MLFLWFEFCKRALEKDPFFPSFLPDTKPQLNKLQGAIPHIIIRLGRRIKPTYCLSVEQCVLAIGEPPCPLFVATATWPCKLHQTPDGTYTSGERGCLSSFESCTSSELVSRKCLYFCFQLMETHIHMYIHTYIYIYIYIYI